MFRKQQIGFLKAISTPLPVTATLSQVYGGVPKGGGRWEAETVWGSAETQREQGRNRKSWGYGAGEFGTERVGPWPDLDRRSSPQRFIHSICFKALAADPLERGGERCLFQRHLHRPGQRPWEVCARGNSRRPRAERRRECDLSGRRAPSRPLPLRARVSRTAWRSVSCAQLWNAFGRLTSSEGQHPGGRRGAARLRAAGRFPPGPEDLRHPPLGLPARKGYPASRPV